MAGQMDWLRFGGAKPEYCTAESGRSTYNAGSCLLRSPDKSLPPSSLFHLPSRTWWQKSIQR
jgi:hypothetical protein